METVDARPVSNVVLLADDLLRSKATNLEESMHESDADVGAGRKVGPYVLGERLGAGGMGEVFKAFDERLERPVALKQIRPDAATESRARRRFKREARAAARLNHPGIVKLHDVVSEDDSDWIVMELVEGQTLAELIESGPLSAEKALALALDLAQALNAAHSEGIVHRDLKTKNVLVTSEARIKILDFGLAKQILFQDGQSTSMTADGQVVGTPHAMSPEQAMGRKVDLRSDLFSLGSLFYEMVTGVAPFKGDNPVETLRQVCTLEPPAIKDRAAGFPQAFSDLVAKLLEKEPAHRPRTAAEVVAELQRLVDLPLDEALTVAGPAPDEDTGTVSDGLSSHSTGERRQVTVMCCELVSGDESSGSLDPELLYGVMAEFEELAREVVESSNGHVVNILGHRLVACLGYPEAREDDPIRALDLVFLLASRCQKLRSDSGGGRYTIRVGVHTGAAIAMSDEPSKRLILGQTQETSARLQSMAAAGEVLISGETRRLVTQGYELEEAQEPELEADPRYGTVFRVRKASSSSESLMEENPQIPMVGREREIAILRGCLERARDGDGNAVLISGEAGIGKSRLVQDLRQGEISNAHWISIEGSPARKSSPLFVVIELLRKTLEVSSSMDELLGLEDLEARLSKHGLDPAKTIPFVGPLLGISLDGRYGRPDLAPQKIREKTFQIVLHLVANRASETTLVVLVEDLQWMDPLSLELLGAIAERASGTALLLLLTSRPELDAPWGSEKVTTQLNLSRLAGAEVSVLVSEVTGGRAVPDELLGLIQVKTDGIPLFVEELTKHILEMESLVEKDGRLHLTGEVEDLEIPLTLRDSLTARLDRLGSAKRVAQLAAVIGRVFTQELLLAVSEESESSIRQGLDQLMGAELIYRKGFAARRRYIFKHALIQEAAYDSMLKRHRVGCHHRIASALVGGFPKIAESRPEEIAHHYTEALKHDSAIEYWKKAGERALQQSADIEARSHFQKGISLLESIPDEQRRVVIEADLQSALGTTLMSLEGFASPLVKSVQDRARVLFEQTRDNVGLFWTLRNLRLFRVSVSDAKGALAIAEEMLRLAEAENNVALLISAYTDLAGSNYFMGNFAAARELQEKCVSLDDFGRKQTYSFALDPGVENLSNFGLTLWHLGFPDQAEKYLDQAVELAKQLSHAFSLSLALFQRAWLRNNRRRWAWSPWKPKRLFVLVMSTDSRFGLPWDGSSWAGPSSRAALRKHQGKKRCWLRCEGESRHLSRPARH